MASYKKHKTTTQSWEIERLDPRHAPWYSKKLILEHVERYKFASQYCRNKTVVDLGSGTGYGSKIIAENGAKKIYSVDIDSRAVEYARKYFRHKIIHNIIASADNTKLPEKTADVVICFEVMEHLRNPDKLLHEIFRILKPEGVCIFSTPNKETSYNDNPYHLKEYTVQELKLILSDYSNIQFYGQRQINRIIIQFYQLLHRLIPVPFIRLLLRFRPWETYYIQKLNTLINPPFLYLLVICQK